MNVTNTATSIPFNGIFSRTTWVSQHQKGKPFWSLMKQEMMGWQCLHLDHVQIICTLLLTYSHTSTLSLSFLQAWCPSCLPTVQQHQSTVQKGIWIWM